VSKPILEVTLQNVGGQTSHALTVFDARSRYTMVRESALPADTQVLPYRAPDERRTVAQAGRVRVTGWTHLVISIGDRMIEDYAGVSPDLPGEAIIGAETMRMWEVSIRNDHGHTSVVVGRDMRDPDIIEVDSL